MTTGLWTLEASLHCVTRQESSSALVTPQSVIICGKQLELCSTLPQGVFKPPAWNHLGQPGLCLQEPSLDKNGTFGRLCLMSPRNWVWMFQPSGCPK